MPCQNKPPNMQIWSRGFCSFCKFIERSSGRRHIIYDEQGCILREQAYCRRKTNAAFRFFNLSDLVSFTWEVVAFTFLKQGTRGISSWVASSFARSSDWLYPFWKYLRYRCEGTKEIKSWSFCMARVRSGLSCVNNAHLSAKNPAISLLWWNLSLRMSFLRRVL